MFQGRAVKLPRVGLLCVCVCATFFWFGSWDQPCTSYSWGCRFIYVSKTIPTNPWNIPQTLNYPFMKEILNHICILGYLGSVGIFLEFYILIGQIASWESQKTQPQSWMFSCFLRFSGPGPWKWSRIWIHLKSGSWIFFESWKWRMSACPLFSSGDVRLVFRGSRFLFSGGMIFWWSPLAVGQWEFVCHSQGESKIGTPQRICVRKGFVGVKHESFLLLNKNFAAHGFFGGYWVTTLHMGNGWMGPMSYPVYVSNEKNPGCLWYIGDCTTQLYGDYNKPL